MQPVKIGFSFGLLSMVLTLAACLGFIGVGLVGLNYLLHLQSQKQCCDCCPQCKCVNCKCEDGGLLRLPKVTPKGKFEPVRSGTPLPEVNERARDEIKQQSCPTCPQSTPRPSYLPMPSTSGSMIQGGSYQHAAKLAATYGATVVTTKHTDGRPLTYAALRNGMVWASTGIANTKGHVGPLEQAYFNLATEMQQGTQVNAGPRAPSQPGTPQRIAPTDRPTQAKERSHITLFLLPNDPLSAKIEDWFKSDETLAAWRTACTFQVFTPDNKLYRTLRTHDGKRSLAEQVPTSEFPSIVITSPDGGHIHAAGKNFLPATAAEFVADVWKGFEFHKQRPALHSGLLRTTGYSWDNHISPTMRLMSEDCPNCPDCPDGICPPRTPKFPVDDSSRWVPGKLANDMFAKPKNGAVKDLAWGWLEYTITGVIAMVIVLGMFALIVLGGFVLLVVHLFKGTK